MAIDPSSFQKLNVADTCSIWNVLSSVLLHRASEGAGVSFCCTGFVLYECLFKERTHETEADSALKARLEAERAKGSFMDCNLELGDLQQVDILENRQRLSKGELSSIVFARKTNQAFLTDDQKARKLARTMLNASHVQTTPHLFAWLIFSQHLSDADKDQVIAEHTQLERPLSKFFEEAYLEALRCRLMANS